MIKRLTTDQKYFAAVMILTRADYPKTPHMIGREIGFVNGQPIKATLEQMFADGQLKKQDSTYLGKPCVFYWMPKDKRGAILADIREYYGES